MKEDLKKYLNNAKEELKESQAKTTSLEREISDLKNTLSNQEVVNNNNLKYLIHHNRNVRNRNFLIMGLEENVMLTVNDASAETDEDKVELLLNFLEPGTAIDISEMFLMGKAWDDRTRPLKVRCQDNASVSKI